MDEKTAKNVLECEGCKHRDLGGSQGWCYMFEKKPEILPCGQHDKYAEIRRATGMLIKNNPAIIAAMIRNMSRL